MMFTQPNNQNDRYGRKTNCVKFKYNFSKVTRR